jgi:hypothetical protein
VRHSRTEPTETLTTVRRRDDWCSEVRSNRSLPPHRKTYDERNSERPFPRTTVFLADERNLALRREKRSVERHRREW